MEDLLRRLPAELVRSKKSDLEAADALIRAALRRAPTDAEKELLAKHLQKVKDREAGYQDLLWAAMNSTEFVKAHQFANAAEVRQFSEKIVQAWKKK